MGKTIGIVGYRNRDANSFGIGVNYAEYLSNFGSIRIIMPDEDLVKVDLLVLPGGADLNPSSFGQSPGFRTGDTDVHKQHFYDNKLKLYVESKIPIFGICLGFQMINSFFGGTLVQHLTNHQSSPNRYEKGHKVFQCEPSGRIIGKSKFDVNSHHHQGVSIDGLSKELIPLLVAEHENEGKLVIEALKHKTLPIIGVQYHPEEWFDEFSSKVINYLLNVKEEVLA